MTIAYALPFQMRFPGRLFVTTDKTIRMCCLARRRRTECVDLRQLGQQQQPMGRTCPTVFITSAGSNRLNQINPYSILSPFRKSKTSDFFEANIRTFDAKHPYFCPKKSDVFKGCSINQLGKSPSLTPGPMSLLSSPRKKFWKNILHFLHPCPKHVVFTDGFRCRIGCRIAFPGVG